MSIATSHSSPLTRGYAIAMLSAAVLSTSAIFIRHLAQAYSMPPLVLAFWRDAFAALSLLLVMALLRPLLLNVKPQDLLYLLMYGLMFAIFNVLWTVSVSLNGAALATVLVYCSVAFTALLGWWLLRERLGWVKLMAIAFSLGGCALVSGALDRGAWSVYVVGILAGMLSGLCYAIYSLMGRSASQRGLNPWTTLFYTVGFAAAFLLLLNLLPEELFLGPTTYRGDLFMLESTPSGWGVLLLLAVGPTVLGFGLYNISLSYLPSSVANLIATLEPVFTAVIAYLLLGERLTAMQLIGSLMILAGVASLRVYEGWLAGQTQARPRRRDSAATRN